MDWSNRFWSGWILDLVPIQETHWGKIKWFRDDNCYLKMIELLQFYVWSITIWNCNDICRLALLVGSLLCAGAASRFFFREKLNYINSSSDSCWVKPISTFKVEKIETKLNGSIHSLTFPILDILNLKWF